MTTNRTRKTASTDGGESESAAKSTRKAPAKKSAPAKETSAAKKSAPAKKTSAAKKTSPAKKTSAAKKSEAAKSPEGSTQSRVRASAPSAESKPRAKATDVARSAVLQLTELTGRSTEGVTGIEQLDDGWQVTVEVLEVRRIPETTDVLAQYEIDTDDKGGLTGYRRVARYTRGSARED